METLSDFESYIIDAVIDLRHDHLRSRVHAVTDTSTACSEINYHLRGSSKQFFELSVQFDAFNGYFVDF